MDAKKKHTHFSFDEGHKRETRKSYQKFLNELGLNAPADVEEELIQPEHESDSSRSCKTHEMSDDQRTRKSKRAPVPKRSFGLIDDYEDKKKMEHCAQGQAVKIKIEPGLDEHEFGLKQVFTPTKSKSRIGKESRDSRQYETEVLWPTKRAVKVEREVQESPSKLKYMSNQQYSSDDYSTDSSAMSRRSARTPVPKKNFSLIEDHYASKAKKGTTNKDNLASEISEEDAATFASILEKTKLTPKSLEHDTTGFTNKEKLIPQNKQKKSEYEKKNRWEDIKIKKEVPDIQKNENIFEKLAETRNKRKLKDRQANEELILKEDIDISEPVRKKSKKSSKSNNKPKLQIKTVVKSEVCDNEDSHVSHSDIEKVNSSPDKIDLLKDEPKGRRSKRKMLAAKHLQKSLEASAEGIKESVVVVPEKSKETRSKSLETTSSKINEGAKEPKKEKVKNKLSLKISDDDSVLDRFVERCLAKSPAEHVKVTERPDGHIILKVEGIHSPTKHKKHKKKHHHHHHERESVNVDPSDQSPTKGHDKKKKGKGKEDKSIVKPAVDNNQSFSSVSDIQLSSPESEKKKGKKRKRNESIEEIDEEHKAFPSYIDLPISPISLKTESDGKILKIKKRKVYKKKNGQRILVRIQTEYIDEYGDVVKVNSNDMPVSPNKVECDIKDETKTIELTESKDQHEKSENDLIVEQNVINKEKPKKKKKKKVKGKKKEEINGVKSHKKNAKKKNTDERVITKVKESVDESKGKSHIKVKSKKSDLVKKKSKHSSLATSSPNDKHNKLKSSPETMKTKTPPKKTHQSPKKTTDKKEHVNIEGTNELPIAKKKISQSSKKRHRKPDMPKKDTLDKSTPDNVEPSPQKKKKERKSQTLTAYLLYCRKFRKKVVEHNNDMSFAEISRTLAHMWSKTPDNEKNVYRKQLEEHKAKINAALKKQDRYKTTAPEESTVVEDSSEKALVPKSKKEKDVAKDFNIPRYSLNSLEPMDMAAHLQLLGDSLTMIATALRRQGNMTVHGALSVLLDSCLCAMAPLIFLTTRIPEIDGIPNQTKANILDNIAFILPGL